MGTEYINRENREYQQTSYVCFPFAEIYYQKDIVALMICIAIL
jgi:hypothetical protein